MIVNPPKSINLLQLQGELQNAGITISRGLGSIGDPVTEVFTYSSDGEQQELPPGSSAVIEAHVPGPDAATVARLEAVAVALNNPTAYLDPAVVASPTDAQKAAAQVQRNAWAAILGVGSLTIPVTQAATAADIRPQ